MKSIYEFDRKPVAFAVGLWLTSVAGAQNALPPIEVKGQALLRSDSSPATQTTIDADELRDLAVSTPEKALARVPGLRVMTYGLGGVVNVISLRGFGGGAHGGDIAMVLDGLPLNEAISHADGYADLNVVIPLELERLDVVKGPSSVLVGNYNRAGAIFLQTRKRGDYQLADVSLGSFRTFDTQVAGGFRVGERGHANLAAQVFTTNDFRPNSGFDRGTVSGRYTHEFAQGDVTVSTRLHQGNWDAASYLPLAQFNAGDADGRSPLASNDGGEKEFYTLRLDASREVATGVKLLAFLYGTQQSYTRFFSRPVSLTAWRQRDETYHREVGGAGFSLNGQHALAGAPLKWAAGAEHYREKTNYDYFDGTTQRARLGTPVARQNRDYRFDSTGAFATAEWDLSPLLRPTLGARWDRFTGACDVRSPEVVGATDPLCNVPLTTKSHTSPKAGVRSTVAPGVDLRASVNEGFQLANVRGLYAPTNGTAPNTFRQKEIGATLGPWQGFRFDAAAWRLDSDNEIREIPAGSNLFFNSGRTRRTGHDIAASWSRSDWEASLAYGRAQGRVRENPNPALVGKKLNGVPDETATLAAAYAPPQGFGGFVQANRVGRYFYDSAALNTLSWPGYTTLDAGVTWRGSWRSHALKLRLAVNNITDKVYASNAFQIGGQNLVAPGAPRNAQASLQVDFK